MAVEMKGGIVYVNYYSWGEVAPALLITPRKIFHSPPLETITEADIEAEDEHDDQDFS